MKNLCYLLLLISSVTFAQEIDFNKRPHLETKATYTMEVAPDKITLGITLSETDSKGKVSLETLENKLQNVLRKNDIDIKTQLVLDDVSSDYQKYLLKKTDVEKEKTYQLILHDAVTTGAVLKDLEAEGIANIRLLKTEYEKEEELKITLRGKAVAKAKKQAEAMVGALDQKLGKAIYISDTSVNIGYYRTNYATNSVQLNENTNAPDVNFESIEVQASVTVYFELE
ncbi:SIMPL domain-containing protein [Pustulibacterium marinum]|nr:SIMPL domain-containing protein [Pustulibacterium marinum]